MDYNLLAGNSWGQAIDDMAQRWVGAHYLLSALLLVILIVYVLWLWLWKSESLVNQGNKGSWGPGWPTTSAMESLDNKVILPQDVGRVGGPVNASSMVLNDPALQCEKIGELDENDPNAYVYNALKQDKQAGLTGAEGFYPRDGFNPTPSQLMQASNRSL